MNKGFSRIVYYATKSYSYHYAYQMRRHRNLRSKYHEPSDHNIVAYFVIGLILFISATAFSGIVIHNDGKRKKPIYASPGNGDITTIKSTSSQDSRTEQIHSEIKRSPNSLIVRLLDLGVSNSIEIEGALDALSSHEIYLSMHYGKPVGSKGTSADFWLQQRSASSWKLHGSPFGISTFSDSYECGFKSMVFFRMKTPEEQISIWERVKSEEVAYQKKVIADSEANDARIATLQKENERRMREKLEKPFSPGTTVYLTHSINVKTDSVRAHLKEGSKLEIIESLDKQAYKVVFRPNPYRETEFIVNKSQIRE